MTFTLLLNLITFVCVYNVIDCNVTLLKNGNITDILSTIENVVDIKASQKIANLDVVSTKTTHRIQSCKKQGVFAFPNIFRN